MSGFDDDEFTPPTPTDPLDAWAAKSGSPVTDIVTGILVFDDIEGGCPFLETPDGRRYEVVYPADWILDRAGARLRGPDGRSVPAGRPVTVRGAIATDRSSICQVGPILVATEVHVPLP